MQAALDLSGARPPSGPRIFSGFYRTRAGKRVTANGFVPRLVERVVRQVMLLHVVVDLLIIPRKQRRNRIAAVSFGPFDDLAIRARLGLGTANPAQPRR